MLDNRSLSLAGEPSWIRSNIEVYTHGGTMNSHDWLRLVQGAGDYMLADLYEDTYKMDALYALVAACNGCLTKTSAYDSDNREEANKLKEDVIVALCKCESVIP